MRADGEQGMKAGVLKVCLGERRERVGTAALPEGGFRSHAEEVRPEMARGHRRCSRAMEGGGLREMRFTVNRLQPGRKGRQEADQ